MILTTRVGASCLFALLSWLPNAAFAQCKQPGFDFVPMSAVIGQGGYLSSDGRGAYVDGTQASTVNLHNAARVILNEGANANRTSRFVSFNLNSPNPASDPVFALALGVIQDQHAEAHVLYTLDPADSEGLRQIHSIQELPDDGVFYTSARTDLFVRIGGIRHLLMFGGDTWPINICSPSVGVVFGAPGTTTLQIARLPGSDTYVLQAPAGSIARLFDYSNTFAPIDKGVYRFSFVVTFSPKPAKGKK